MERTIFNEDHEMFRDASRAFLINEIGPYRDKWEEQEIVDREAFLKAGEQGLLCMWADEKYGGADWGVRIEKPSSRREPEDLPVPARTAPSGGYGGYDRGMGGMGGFGGSQGYGEGFY